MHGQFLPLDVQGEAFRSLADLLGGALDTVGEDVAEAFAFADFVDHGDHSVGVAPGQVDAVGLFLGEEAVFVAFHGESDGDAGGDAVEDITVDPLRRFGDGGHVAHAAQRSQRADDLVFHAAILGRNTPFRHFDFAFTGDGTGVAGATIHKDGVGHARAGDGVGMRKRSIAEVVGGENAVCVQPVDAAGGAVQVHAVGFAIVVVAEPLENAVGFLAFLGGHPFTPTGDDGFEVLAAHHRAQTGAPVEVTKLVDNGRIQDQILARHPGLEDVDAFVA